MASTSNTYGGGSYLLDGPSYKDYSAGLGDTGYGVRPSTFGFTTDPRTSNQVKAVSDKISTGAKTIEVSGVNLGGQAMEQIDSIPKQQFKEINRLKKLVGNIDLTFHGPLLEPTGAKQGWDPTDRMEIERQMVSAVKRAHDLDPNGNVVVTFHASNGLPDPITKVKIKDETTGKDKEIITDVWVVNERDGRFESIKPKESFLEGTKFEDENSVKKLLQNQNEENWFKQLQGVSYHAYQGAGVIERPLMTEAAKGDKEEKEAEKQQLAFYKEYLKNPAEAEKTIASLPKEEAEVWKEKAQQLVHGDLYLRDAYTSLKGLFDMAYDSAQKENRTEDLRRLEAFRKEIAPKIGYIKDPDKIKEFSDEIIKGVNVLRGIEAPRMFKPLKEFAVDKASDTFSNVAYEAYKEFKDSTPIVSIENPPAGMGISRAEDIKKIIDAAQNKFVEKAMDDGMSEGDARKQAKKLIGATWDVGHINMLRKYGYNDKDLIKQAEIIAKNVKHVHLSDNFGMEHTELPMGMGNVPLKPQLDLIKKYNDKVKMIVETGGAWFRDFKATPFSQTLAAFGSPVYGMKMGPQWSNQTSVSAGYFSGYGPTLPDQHFSMYGAGFSTLPVELGGQVAGRSRVSGTPIE